MFENHSANLNKTWHSTFLNRGDLILFLNKGAYNMIAKYMYRSTCVHNFLQSSSPELQELFQTNLAQSILEGREASLFKSRAKLFSKGR